MPTAYMSKEKKKRDVKEWKKERMKDRNTFKRERERERERSVSRILINCTSVYQDSSVGPAKLQTSYAELIECTEVSRVFREKA